MVDTITSADKIGIYELSIDECKNPHLVIQDLFSSFHHSEIKELMWEWLASTFCENFSTYFDSEEKLELTLLYEKIRRLIDTAHIMFCQEKTITSNKGEELVIR